MHLIHKISVAALLVSTLFAVPQYSHATLILADAFSGINGTSVNGRTPDTANLPGGTYINRNYFGQTDTQIDTSFGNPIPSALMSANNLSYISIATTGGYTKPSQLRISADITLGPSNPVQFFDLGFILGDPGTGNANHMATNNGFNGLRINSDGSLSLKTSTSSDGGPENLSPVLAYNSIALGPFSTSVFYKLSYDVDFTTGDISNIVLSNGIGSVSADVSTTAFTDLFTSFASFASASGVGNTFSHLDNFMLQTIPVPEPSTFALLSLGAIGLAIRTRRRRATA